MAIQTTQVPSHQHFHGAQDTAFPGIRNLYGLWYARFLPQAVLGDIDADGRLLRRTTEGERAGAPLQAKATDEFVKIAPALLIGREVYETRNAAALKDPEVKQAVATTIAFFAACGHDHHERILTELDQLYRQAPPLGKGKN